VLVFTAPSVPAAAVARGLLEGEGIPVLVKGETEGPYRLGPAYLFVPEEHAQRARELFEDPEGEGWGMRGGDETWVPDDEQGWTRNDPAEG
jgi:hypothetical protein